MLLHRRDRGTGGRDDDRLRGEQVDAVRRLALVPALTLALALTGCAPTLRMHAVDSIARRMVRVLDAAEILERVVDVEVTKATDVAEATKVTKATKATEPDYNTARISAAAKIVLYETQEVIEWVKPLRKDVGVVPEKKRLELDSAPERDTRFEYIVRAGAKASRRARRKAVWDALLDIPRRIITWTVTTVWNILPWWVKWPILLALAAWAGGTCYVYWAKMRAARAAAQGEAVLARLQKYVAKTEFAEAVDPIRNADLARVHEAQVKRTVKR